MHAHGIVHRDLKPRNVLVGEHDRRLKICDLSLTRSAASPPPDAQQLDGTIGYIAPKALLCEKDCGAPVDMWVLGCTMAELVMAQSTTKKRFVGSPCIFRGRANGNPLLQIEHSYCSIRPATRKVFLVAGDAITRSCKWASFSGAGALKIAFLEADNATTHT
jgi:serine/threonine protein kinase